MNKTRRADIMKLHNQLDTLRDQISELSAEISELSDEEQDYYDNMPESLQGADKGQAAAAAIDALEEAASEVSGAGDCLETALAAMMTAVE